MPGKTKIEERKDVELSQSKDGADKLEEKMKKEKMERLHWEGMLDLSWIWEAKETFLKRTEKITKLLEDSERGGREEEGQQMLVDKVRQQLEKKLEDGRAKWPEYYNKKKAYWRRRLEVVEAGAEPDAVEGELREQEDEADKLEKELETIEENLAGILEEILEEGTTPKTGGNPDPVLNQLTCPHCGKKYVSYQWLKEHVEKQHADKKESGIMERELPCPHGCEKKYKTLGGLRRHIRAKHKQQMDELADGKAFSCILCKREYASAEWLKQHVREDHPGQPEPDDDEDSASFECKHCGKTYKTQGWLKRHLREKHAEETQVEEGAKGESCGGNGANTAPITEEHSTAASVTTGTSAVSCAGNEGQLTSSTRHSSGNGNTRRDEVQEAEKTGASVERGSDGKLICPYCDRIYASVGWLKRHVQKEHEGEPDPDIDEESLRFKCKHCGKTYKTQGWLNRHLREKHDVRPQSDEVACDSDEDCVKLRCPHCDKTYKKMGWLDQHIREEHPKVKL